MITQVKLSKLLKFNDFYITMSKQNNVYKTKWYTFISLGRLWRKNIGNDLHIVLLKKSIIQCHYVVNICDAAVVWD